MKTKWKIFKKIHVYQISLFLKNLQFPRYLYLLATLLKTINRPIKKKANKKDKSFVRFPWKSFYMKKTLLEIFMLFHPFVQVNVLDRFIFACFGDNPILSFCLQV